MEEEKVYYRYMEEHSQKHSCCLGESRLEMNMVSWANWGEMEGNKEGSEENQV